MKPYKTLTTLIGLSLVGSAGAVTLIADPAADFAIGTDGNATTAAGWSYVTAATATGTGTDLVWSGVGNGGNSGFGGGPTTGNFSLPAVVGSQIAGQYEIFNDGADQDGNANRYTGHGGIVGTDILLHPSNQADENFLILRYEVSATDILGGADFTIVGSFRDLSGLNTTLQANNNQAGSINAQVFYNATQLFTATGSDGGLTQADGSFNLSQSGVTAGDTFSFVVDMNGNQAGDETALTAKISSIPEPSSVLLAGFGALGLLVCRRR